MEDIRFLLSSFRREIRNILIWIVLIQIASIYIYNFQSDWKFFDLFRNIVTGFDFCIFIGIPYWLSRKLFGQKIYQPQNASWLFGLVINTLMLAVFTVLGVADFTVKWIVFGVDFFLSRGVVLLMGSALGAIVVLFLGCISAVVSGIMIKGKAS